ncbi:MAG TPA: DUF4252 domain-containing protein [Saprospiraceae bacterium]|nr:DUF4252 domain-containing protein [Saprospiraceae bacterium]
MKLFKIAIAFILVVGFGATAHAQANAIDKYFSQYVNDKNFTVVYISPKMFQMMDNFKIKGMDDNEGKAILEIAKDLRGLRVLTTDVDAKKYYREAKSKINTNEYEMLMTVRDKDGESVEFFVKDAPGGNGNVFEEFFLMVGGEDEFVLISFVGKIDIAKISRLANSIEGKDDNKSKSKQDEE